MAFIIDSEAGSLSKVDIFNICNSITWAYIAITDACTLECRWCYADSKNQQIHMPLEKYKKILSILKNSGVKQITLGGGEPLQHPNFIEIITLASKLGFKTNINTNALFLDEIIIQKLVENGISQVAIDLESTKNFEHDLIRGKQGAFEKSLNAIDKLIKTQINVVIQTVLTNQNLDDVISVFKLAVEKNVSKFRILDLLPIGKAKKLISEVPKPLKYYMNKICREAENLGIKKFISYDPIFPMNDVYKFEAVTIRCPSSMGLMGYILPDGNMSYCASAMDIKLYNVLDYSNIVSIHKKTISQINNKKFNNNCLLCNHNKTCSGGCIARFNGSNIDYSCPNL